MPQPVQLKKWLQWTIVALFLGLIVRYFLSNREELDVLRHIEPVDVALLFFMTLIIYIAHAFNVQLTLYKLGLKPMPLMEWFKIFVISRYINFHVPQGRILYLGYKLKRDHGFTYTGAASMFTYLTWFYTITTLIFCSVLLVIAGAPPAEGANVQLYLWTAILSCVIGPWALKAMPRPGHTGGKWGWFLEKLDCLIKDMKIMIADRGLLLRMFLLSLLQFALYVIIVHLSFLAIHHPLSLEKVLLFTVTILLSKFFSIVPNNVGVTELLCGYLSDALGGKISTGVIVSGVIRIVDYLLISLLGLMYARSFIPQYKEENA